MKLSAFRLISALAAVVALALFALSYSSPAEPRSEHGWVPGSGNRRYPAIAWLPTG